MDKKRTDGEMYLLDMRLAIQRVLATEDGKKVMEFMRSMTCCDFAMPTEYLQTAEGARRVPLMLENMAKDVPEEQFLAHCEEHYAGDSFFK